MKKINFFFKKIFTIWFKYKGIERGLHVLTHSSRLHNQNPFLGTELTLEEWLCRRTGSLEAEEEEEEKEEVMWARIWKVMEWDLSHKLVKEPLKYANCNQAVPSSREIPWRKIGFPLAGWCGNHPSVRPWYRRGFPLIDPNGCHRGSQWIPLDQTRCQRSLEWCSRQELEWNYRGDDRYSPCRRRDIEPLSRRSPLLGCIRHTADSRTPCALPNPMLSPLRLRYPTAMRSLWEKWKIILSSKLYFKLLTGRDFRDIHILVGPTAAERVVDSRDDILSVHIHNYFQ